MYFTLRKHQFSYTFMSCKIVPSALPHCENSNGFLTKAIKEKKKNTWKLITIFPNVLTYKDWDF